jgi:hypothetical protein
MILLQIAAGLLVAWIYYMLGMLMTTYDGFPSLVLQPFMGALFALVAVLLCSLIGLPIRRVASVRRFWRSVWWLPLLLGALGFVLMVLSWLPPFRQTVYDELRQMEVQTFQPTLALSGWLLSVFAALHFWFPLPGFLRRSVGGDHSKI